MSGKISIIVPVYNCDKYLRRCIESLVSQSYKDIEIILIDDGSTDKSMDICQEMAAKDHRIKYVRQSNAGVSSARNHGLNIATGKYIGFCDSDDWAAPNMYENLVNLIEEYSADVAIVRYINEVDGRVCSFNDSNKIITFSGKQAILEMHKAKLFEGQLWNKLFRAELFLNTRLDEKIIIFEDLLILWSIFLKANTVVFHDKSMYHYAINSSSALNQPYRNADWQRREACIKMLEIARMNYADAIPYVKKTFLMADLRLAEKMCVCGKLSSNKRAFLTKEMRSLYDSEVDKLLTSDRRKKINLFFNHHILFCLTLNSLACLSNCKRVAKKYLFNQTIPHHGS